MEDIIRELTKNIQEGKIYFQYDYRVSGYAFCSENKKWRIRKTLVKKDFRGYEYSEYSLEYNCCYILEFKEKCICSERYDTSQSSPLALSLHILWHTIQTSIFRRAEAMDRANRQKAIRDARRELRIYNEV